MTRAQDGFVNFDDWIFFDEDPSMEIDACLRKAGEIEWQIHEKKMSSKIHKT